MEVPKFIFKDYQRDFKNKINYFHQGSIEHEKNRIKKNQEHKVTFKDYTREIFKMKSVFFQ